MKFISSPLEQFQVLPIIPIKLGIIDLSITNETIIILLLVLLTTIYIFSLIGKDQTFHIIPNRW